MHLTAVSFGSRGDIEPFLTLGRGLAEAGHHVRILTHPEYAHDAADSGMEFIGARGRSTRELIESDEGREVMRHVRNPVVMMRRIAAVLAPELRLIYEDVLSAVRESDAVLAFPATFPALDVADHLGCPILHIHHVPMVPTRHFPIPAAYIRTRTLTPLGNRASYQTDAWMLWQLTRGAVDRARREVLGPAARDYGIRQALAQRRRRVGSLVGVSRHVVTPPADWPADTVVCGYWWPHAGDGDTASALTAETRRFLADGPAPLFFGLGSTPVADPAAVTRDVAGAARDAQVRLILQSGWAGLGGGIRDPGVHVVGDVAYDALFPHVAGVVHHGGAGTTALGLRHARPTLCIPAVADQFFWGHRMAAIGAGPSPLPLGRLRRDRLAGRLAALARDGGYAARASQIAVGLAGEDGSATAVAAVDRLLPRRGAAGRVTAAPATSRL
ncbi:MAG TPA: glycosyltransferase [Solirubrobacteraceae bacterium]|jgi:UDP:flavonoid glycosyltransferase YjiC (YdhE family)|nr:glycosyltransferase [Solirubrobacteraceae bacterium]